jgi:hypothetical protein
MAKPGGQPLRRILRHHPSPALVIACTALLIAMTGTGIAAVQATVPNNSVGSAQLKSNAVTAAKIASNAVTSAKIASNAVASAKIAGNAVTTAKVADGSLLKTDFKDGELPPAANAYARFLNGPISVPVSSTTLGSLTIPEAGSYVIWGKAYVTGLSNVITCRLVAGTDFDESQASPSTGAPATLAMVVVHTYTAPGSADFTCSGTIPGGAASFIKIAAIKVAALTNNG